MAPSGIEPAIMESSKQYVHTRLYAEYYINILFSSQFAYKPNSKLFLWISDTLGLRFQTFVSYVMRYSPFLDY